MQSDKSKVDSRSEDDAPLYGIDRYSKDLPDSREGLLKAREVLLIEMRDTRHHLRDPFRRKNLGAGYKEWVRRARMALYIKRQQLSAINHKLIDTPKAGGVLHEVMTRLSVALVSGEDVNQAARDCVTKIDAHFKLNSNKETPNA